MRIKPEIDLGIEGEIYIDVSDRWTKREVDACRNASPEEYIEEWFPKKVSALSIPCESGDITDTMGLTLDVLEDIDYRLYGFVMTSLYKAIGKLFLLSQTS